MVGAKGAVTLLIVFGVTVPLAITGPAEAQFSSEELSGVSIPVREDQEQQYRDTIRSNTDNLPVEDLASKSIYRLIVDQTPYLVISDSEGKVGTATVRGVVLESQTDKFGGLVFADSDSFDTTPTKTITPDDLKSNYDAHVGEFAKIDISANSLAFSGEVQPVEYRQSLVPLLMPTKNGSLILPGRTAGDLVLSLSNESISLQTPYPTSIMVGRLGIVGTEYERTFWYQGNVTMDAVIYPGQAAHVHIGNLKFETETLGSVSEINERGPDLVNKVVTVETAALGSKISSKETLVNAAPCGQDAVTVPSVGCVPVVTDTAVHTGILFTESTESPDDIVPYFGLSNAKADKIASPEQGRYRITGRIIRTDPFYPSLPEGYTLVIYQRSKVGEISSQEVDSELVTMMRNSMQNQIVNARIRNESDSTTTTTEQSTTPQPTSTSVGDTITTEKSKSVTSEETRSVTKTNQSGDMGPIGVDTPGFGFGSVLGALLLLGLWASRE